VTFDPEGWVLNSPLKKALAFLLGRLGAKYEEIIRESLFDWPDEDS
jgi:hypothetical protein